MEALNDLIRDVSAAATLESLVCGKGIPKAPKQRSRRRLALGRTVSVRSTPFDTHERVADVVKSCRDERKRKRSDENAAPIDDAALSSYARFTDGMALKPYEPFLHYVPRLVNIVTLAEAIPVAGSGITLPLNLSMIAARCNGAYFAPKRFAAVQLAYTNPRCRILFFHTGRVVGTGCSGAMAARLAIARAQRQLAEEAGVHLHIRNFSVINQVGAISLKATLNCEGFANEHRSTSHYDQQSFVGLAWRPENESSCCEIYSTGRANLPGSRTERDLLASFSRMLPELLRHSSASRLLSLIPEELQAVHRPRAVALAPPPATVVHGRQVTAHVMAAAPSAEPDDDDQSFGDGDEGASGEEDLDDALLDGLGL